LLASSSFRKGRTSASRQHGRHDAPALRSREPRRLGGGAATIVEVGRDSLSAAIRRDACTVGAGHSFFVFVEDTYPVNVLADRKALLRTIGDKL
jgi:hypothetical protein